MLIWQFLMCMRSQGKFRSNLANIPSGVETQISLSWPVWKYGRQRPSLSLHFTCLHSAPITASAFLTPVVSSP